MKVTNFHKTLTSAPEDGPEEGEIVSDDLEDISDDLEDISDEPIIFTPSNGKSLSRSDHLQALSLSSVSDVEDIPLVNRRKRKRSVTQRHTRRRKRSRRRNHSSSSDDGDNDTTLDRRLKLQLKAAVQVDAKDTHRNSLRTRLRAMVNGNSSPDSDSDLPNQKIEESNVEAVSNSAENPLDQLEKNQTVIEIESGSDSVIILPECSPSVPEIVLSGSEHVPSPDQPDSGSEKPKEENDNELIHLRLEALKTALSNKYANKKKRKKENCINVSSDETNKENTNNNSGDSNQKTDAKVEIPQTSPQSSTEPENEVPLSPEEDEDVLRALLLASMSKKITDVTPEPVKTVTTVQPPPPVKNIFSKVTVNKKINNINNFKVNNVNKVNNGRTIVNKASGNTKLIKMPKVKPLIIKVNSDSDSDMDLSSSPEKSPQKPKVDSNLESAIENSVEKFLREQRAKVESEKKTVSETDNQIVNTVKTVTNKNLVSSTTAKSIQHVEKIKLPTIKQIDSLISKITHTSKTSYSTDNNNSDDLEKSSVRFLPKNKREEYKKLKHYLKMSQKKPRARRISQKVDDNLRVANQSKEVNSNVVLGVKVVPQVSNRTFLSSVMAPVANTQAVLPNSGDTGPSGRTKLNRTKLASKSESMLRVDNRSQLSKMEQRTQEKKTHQLKMETEKRNNDALYQATLKQIYTKIDGRLQIRDRYKCLQPLVERINDMDKERQKWDQEVKRLQEQLSEAKKKQQKFQVDVSTLVKGLASKKRNMDDSFEKNTNKVNMITSTPLKTPTLNQQLDISAVEHSVPDSTKPGRLACSDNREKRSTHQSENIADKNIAGNNVSENTWDHSTVVGADDTLKNIDPKRTDVDLNVVDPNDIDRVIEKTAEKVAILDKKECLSSRRVDKVRYVSPLDSVKRDEEFDPFAIMCPYEVNGTCKDPECTFKHLH